MDVKELLIKIHFEFATFKGLRHPRRIPEDKSGMNEFADIVENVGVKKPHNKACHHVFNPWFFKTCFNEHRDYDKAVR